MPVGVIFWAAVCFVSSPAFARWVLRARGTRFFGHWACFGLCAVPGSALTVTSDRDWVNVAAWGASGLLGLILWWHSRRKGRRKALRLLGNKTRAVLAAMARNMPRPSPRLAPQGARA